MTGRTKSRAAAKRPSLPWLRPITAHSVRTKLGQLRCSEMQVSDRNTHLRVGLISRNHCRSARMSACTTLQRDSYASVTPPAAHYRITLRRLQNRKYITYYSAASGGPSPWPQATWTQNSVKLGSWYMRCAKRRTHRVQGGL